MQSATKPRSMTPSAYYNKLLTNRFSHLRLLPYRILDPADCMADYCYILHLTYFQTSLTKRHGWRLKRRVSTVTGPVPFQLEIEPSARSLGRARRGHVGQLQPWAPLNSFSKRFGWCDQKLFNLLILIKRFLFLYFINVWLLELDKA